MPSDKHIQLARKCLIWLGSRATMRGVRGTEEVKIIEGYKPDAVAICSLIHSEEKKFLKDNDTGNSNFNWCEFGGKEFVWIFECKVSNSDFANTFKRGKHVGDRLKPLGNFHFVVTPKGMVNPNDVPSFWGLIEESGGGLSIKKMPTYKEISLEQLHTIAYKILWSSKIGKFTYWTGVANDIYQEQPELGFDK